MKDEFRQALLLTSLVFVFAAASANCQKTPSNNEDVPTAPSTTQATSCTESNGNPCPEWVHKLIGQYPPPPESGQFQPQRDPSTVHFWTYRGFEDPPLRTNKEVFRSKLFLATHIGGAIAMIVACRTKNSGEDWGSEVPAVAGMFGLDYIQFRFIGGPNAIGPIYEMVHYGLASTK